MMPLHPGNKRAQQTETNGPRAARQWGSRRRPQTAEPDHIAAERLGREIARRLDAPVLDNEAGE